MTSDLREKNYLYIDLYLQCINRPVELKVHSLACQLALGFWYADECMDLNHSWLCFSAGLHILIIIALKCITGRQMPPAITVNYMVPIGELA